MSTANRHGFKGGFSRNKASGLTVNTNINEHGAGKSMAMKSADWRKTAHSLTSSEDHHVRTNSHSNDHEDVISSYGSSSDVFDMEDAANFDHTYSHPQKDVHWEATTLAPAVKTNLSGDELYSLIDCSSDDSSLGEYAVIHGTKPYTFKVGGVHGEAFESKKISLIDIKLVSEMNLPFDRQFTDGDWCVLEHVAHHSGECHKLSALGELKASEEHADGCCREQNASFEDSEASPKEKDATKLMFADPAIDSIGGVDVKSLHKRDNSSGGSKMRFLDLVARLNNTSRDAVQRDRSGSIASIDAATSVYGGRGPTQDKEDKNDNDRSPNPTKKLNPAAAEFMTRGRQLDPPFAFSHKKLARPALSNVFPEAGHIRQDGLYVPSENQGSAIKGLAGELPFAPHHSQHPRRFNKLDQELVPGRFDDPTSKLLSNLPGLGQTITPFSTMPPASLGPLHNSNFPTDQYGGPFGPYTNPYMPPVPASTSTSQFPGNRFGTYPQHGITGPFAPHQEQLQMTGHSSMLSNKYPNMPPMPNQLVPPMASHNGISVPFNGPAQANAGASDRPFFPVTKKPRGNDPWAQMEYEKFLEWRKTNEPGYHMSCKMRQAHRIVRQQQGGAA